MFDTFVKMLGYVVCELLPFGAEAHTDLLKYYFNYNAITDEVRIVCLFSLALGLLIYFYSDCYKLFKELFRGIWLIIIGRGTVHQICTEYRYLNLLISIIGVTAASILYLMFSEYISSTYYLIGSMLVVSGLVLRTSKTFAFIKADGRILGYKEFFSFFVIQVLASLPGASRMALMMGSGKFLGVENKHLIKFVFISFIPVLIVRIAYGVESFDVLYAALSNNVWWVVSLSFLVWLLTAVSVRIFNSANFYKFYYYLIGLGLWTILDVFFARRGL